MGGLNKKRFEDADERRTPDKTVVEVVDLGGVKAARLTFQPGWKWSECVKPAAGTDTCQANHVGVAISGAIHVVHDDGSEADIGAGDAYTIAPGHDAWVTSDEPFVGYEFDTASAATYAAPK